MQLKTIVTVITFAFLATACSAGGGSATSSNATIKHFWPATGIDKYEQVIYPAEPDNTKWTN